MISVAPVFFPKPTLENWAHFIVSFIAGSATLGTAYLHVHKPKWTIPNLTNVVIGFVFIALWLALINHSNLKHVGWHEYVSFFEFEFGYTTSLKPSN